MYLNGALGPKDNSLQPTQVALPSLSAREYLYG